HHQVIRVFLAAGRGIREDIGASGKQENGRDFIHAQKYQPRRTISPAARSKPYLSSQRSVLFKPAEYTRDATPPADAPTAGRSLPSRFSIAHTQRPVPQQRCRWPATRRLRRTGLTP